MLRLDQHYTPAQDAAHARWALTVHNLSDRDIASPVLNFSSQTRLLQGARIEGAKLAKQIANTVWLSAPEDFVLVAGGQWRIFMTGLSHLPRNASEGVIEAVIWHDNRATALTIGALENRSIKAQADAEREELTPDRPRYFLFPWPQHVDLSGATNRPSIALSSEANTDERRAVATIDALAKRLYPTQASRFDLSEAEGALRLRMQGDQTLSAAYYALTFSADQVELRYGDEEGRQYGLISLAQMAIGAGLGYAWPCAGEIKDGPRYEWRGLHLDVARHFVDAACVSSILDVMAWLKLNRFHWHLTDDEGWRLPSRAFPKLNSIASWRGPDESLSAQYTHLDARYGGYYSKDEIKAIVEKARGLAIEILPEIDLPGHSTALLAAYPELIEPEEASDSYHSVQGFANNALNPANEAIYPFIETVLAEVTEMFPFAYIHIGGDEVDARSWSQSPKAHEFWHVTGTNGAPALQNEFTARLDAILGALGRKTAAWDECAEGGALADRDALLFAWRSREKIDELLRAGFRVVATPGQAYYLDMQSEKSWDSYGAAWAGIAPIEEVYDYEPPCADGSTGQGVLIGVQAGIWTEKMPSMAHINAMAFPRAYAIAETAWSARENKSLPRLLAMARDLPQFSSGGMKTER